MVTEERQTVEMLRSRVVISNPRKVLRGAAYLGSGRKSWGGSSDRRRVVACTGVDVGVNFGG